MNKNRTASFFYNPLMILFLLFSFLFVEFSLERIINVKCTLGQVVWPYYKCCYNILFVTLSVIIVCIITIGRLKNNYKLSSLTLKHLISNALGYKWLTLIILFFFITHLTWAIDSLYKIIIDTELHKNNWMLLLHPVIPICGTFVSAILIPAKQKNNKSLSEADIFVSSMSCVFNRQDNSYMIKPHNLDLLFKPFYNSGIYYPPTGKIEKLSSIKEFLIVPSNALLNCRIDAESDWTPFVSKIKHAEKTKGITIEKFLNAITKYNSSLKEHNESFNYLKDFLSELINVNFTFSEPVDYDKFIRVFNVASELLKEHEKKTSKAVIHISPGTAIPAGAFTALGIKKNRTIIYSLQNVKDEEHEILVSSIDIDVDNLDGWMDDLINDKESKEV